jgi:hypothetical protein
MKHSILAVVLTGAVAGGGTAVFTSSLLDSESYAGPEQIELRGAGGDVSQQLATLERQNSELLARLVELEQRQLMAEANRQPVMDTSTESEELAKLKDEYGKLVTAMNDPQAALPDTLRAGVSQALEDIRAQEEQEREEQQKVAAEKRLEDRIGKLASDLGLDNTQVGAMRDILMTESDTRTEMFTKMREGGDFGNMREEMGNLRDSTNDALSKVLTPIQMEQYKESGGSGGGFRGAVRGGDTGGGGGRRGRGN